MKTDSRSTIYDLHFKSCKLGLISDTNYKKIRNHVNRIIVSKAKSNYYKERFSRRINDLKKTWKHIRKLIYVGDCKIKIDSILNDGAVLSDDNDIAQCFIIEDSGEALIYFIQNKEKSPFL